jgi:hypothetical protein
MADASFHLILIWGARAVNGSTAFAMAELMNDSFILAVVFLRTDQAFRGPCPILV